MFAHEKDYVVPALKAAEPFLWRLPTDIQKSLKLALSVIESNGSCTGDELRAELGNNWVLARRTKRIVEKYGKDVNVHT